MPQCRRRPVEPFLTAASTAGPPSAAATLSRRVPRVGAWGALLLVAFVAGTALRVWQLDIQILVDDEWHAIHKLLRSGPLDILTHLGYADYSIPLTLYYQQLQRTIGLSEWGMHVPPLVAGIGLMLVGPRLLAGSFALPARATWTMLVAISPLLVYHSKIARPYALTSLLTFVAIVVFRSWGNQRRPRDAAIYVA
jgi:predicted membrane-bound mannosyltransferase